ncbi:hypothetical protein AMCSP08_001708 [Streptococcus pneumoniae 2072047]|nr:hypothetical protein AMCSP08_001708 [Streptococcus pneumoniae 2072047]
MLKLRNILKYSEFKVRKNMANILKTIIENDKGEIRRLEKDG